MPETVDQPNKVVVAAQALQDRMKAASGSDTKPAVTAAVKNLANDPSLTAAEKQEAFMQVTRNVVGRECDVAANNPGTLLRAKSVEAQFLAAYMEEYAQQYQNAVIQETIQKIAELKLPERGYTSATQPNATLDAGNIPLPGMRTDPPDVLANLRKDLEPQVQQEWDGLYATAAKAIIDANNNHIDKLSPEAQEFLQICAEVTREKFANREDVDTIVATLTANNCNLRLTAPAVSALKSTSDDPTVKAVQNTIFMRAGQVAQAYINKLDLDNVTVTRQSENVLVAIRKDRQLREKTLSASHAASSGNAATYQPAQLDLSQPTIQRSAAPTMNASSNQPAQSSRPGNVRDALRGAASRVSDAASSLKNTIGEKLERKGSEQKLGDVSPEIQALYKAEQTKLSSIRSKILDNSDPSKINGRSPAKLDALEEKARKIQAKIANMKNDNPGLNQLDRSKVGQVIHSKVRDAAKTVGSKLSQH